MNRRTFLAAGGAVLYGAPARRRPNILIITTDQQSADAMSNRMGDRYLRTPAMDSLAATGTVFNRAYCANPLCVPSRTSMYTGRYPSETGQQTNDMEDVDPRRFPCMGTLFARAGYDTPYFGKWHLPFRNSDTEAHGFRFMKLGKGDDGIAAAAVEYLRAKHDKPFLMVTSLVNPHNICQWARGEELPDGAIGPDPVPGLCPPWRPNHEPQKNEPDIMTVMRRSYQNTRMFPVGNFDENKWRQYVWAYYRMIEKVDGLVGKVLAALRQSGLEENTLVAFTADHGDCQGAHRWNQKTVLFEEAVRVPFILSQKGVTARGVSDRLVHTGVDLIPTLCDYAGIPIPAGLPGLSLKGKQAHEYVIVSNHMVQGVPDGPKPSGRMVRGQRYKYTVYSEGQRREALVDLEKDPGELVNLAADPQHAEALRHNRAVLAAWCRKVGDRFPVVKA